MRYRMGELNETQLGLAVRTASADFSISEMAQMTKISEDVIRSVYTL